MAVQYTVTTARRALAAPNRAAYLDLPANRWFGLAAFAVALGLITLGLLASTFHLGHPKRAWRGLTQWRSSWLSREGVAAVVTYIPAGLAAIGWILLAHNDGVWAWLGAASALLAVVTVYCTAMIYQSLRAIPRWNTPWVAPVSFRRARLRLRSRLDRLGCGDTDRCGVVDKTGLLEPHR
jgi:DMSO reductase anchor subunit